MTPINMQRAELSPMMLPCGNIIDQAISQRVIGKIFKNIWCWMISRSGHDLSRITKIKIFIVP
jgi:hypothetical protein